MLYSTCMYVCLYLRFWIISLICQQFHFQCKITIRNTTFTVQKNYFTEDYTWLWRRRRCLRWKSYWQMSNYGILYHSRTGSKPRQRNWQKRGSLNLQANLWIVQSTIRQVSILNEVKTLKLFDKIVVLCSPESHVIYREVLSRTFDTKSFCVCILHTITHMPRKSNT